LSGMEGGGGDLEEVEAQEVELDIFLLVGGGLALADGKHPNVFRRDPADAFCESGSPLHQDLPRLSQGRHPCRQIGQAAVVIGPACNVYKRGTGELR
jgi:hypothetical protein